MANSRLIVEVRIAWWWTWFYWPLTRVGLWLGLPLNLDVILNDVDRAVKVRVVPDVGQKIDRSIPVPLPRR